jgi:hypothetical protein
MTGERMNPKEKFELFVHIKAICRDYEKQVSEARQIASCAAKIPAEQIPTNPLVAAEVFVRHMDGTSRPFAWMYVKQKKGKEVKAK